MEVRAQTINTKAHVLTQLHLCSGHGMISLLQLSQLLDTDKYCLTVWPGILLQNYFT